MEKNKQTFFLRLKNSVLHPAIITLILMVIVAGVVIIQEGGDPLSLARIGTKFSQGISNGTEGYDGQFIYYIAIDPYPQTVKTHLDVPAYRYQRILLPVLARVISLGNSGVIPWAIILINVFFHTAATWVLSTIFERWGINKWYGLVYGAWVGIGLAIRLDLSEPLAYGLVIFAIYAYIKEKHVYGWFEIGLALFAKEVTIIFLGAFLLYELVQKRWKNMVGLIFVACIPFGLFQLWLWYQFGQPGIGSGGAMATPFEIIPYMGLLRIGIYSPLYLAMMIIVFGPSVVFPSIWGAIASVKKWMSKERNLWIIVLFLNCLAIMFMPFSTFRETGGLLRYSSGLVLSLLLFAAHYRQSKVLNYSFLWLVLNIFYFK